MAMIGQGDMKKRTHRNTGRRKGDILVGREGDKQREVTVRHEAVSLKNASSVWSWHEEFSAEWSETL